MINIQSRYNVTPLVRRRGRKFSEATVLRMLFIMLGVIFVLYVSLMFTIARHTHTFHANPVFPSHTSHKILEHVGIDQKQREQSIQQFISPKVNFEQGEKESHATMKKVQPIMDDTATSEIAGSAKNNSARILQAFLEPIDQNSWEVKPLPERKYQKNDLKVISYPQLSSCSRLTEQWPVDNFPEEDPFLPWIHDVFPTEDGKFIQFVAQNKRRCDTGKNEKDRKIIMERQPQLSLFQHVPVKRVKDSRYSLSSHEEADPDGVETRFICRFKPSGEETLSRFNLNYDYVAYRKSHKQLFTKEGRWDIKSLHTSQLLFQCPVPDHLQKQVSDGSSVINDFATLFVDIVPIRTPPRYGAPNTFLPPRYSEFNSNNETELFDAKYEWGENHILPIIENSGRWENIPICKPSWMTYSEEEPILPEKKEDLSHRLISCVWASAGYATRGERFGIYDGHRRLREWLHHAFLTGFDHVYVYDNSGANSNATSLKIVTDDFPGKVTRIVWPSKVCNVRIISAMYLSYCIMNL